MFCIVFTLKIHWFFNETYDFSAKIAHLWPKWPIFEKKLTWRGRFRGVEYSTGSENFFLNYEFAKDVSKKFSWKLNQNWEKYRWGGTPPSEMACFWGGGCPLKWPLRQIHCGMNVIYFVKSVSYFVMLLLFAWGRGFLRRVTATKSLNITGIWIAYLQDYLVMHFPRIYTYE